MRATIESTDLITDLDGVKVRVWNGVTDSGVKFTAFIHQVAVNQEEDCTQFDRELQQQNAPSTVKISPVQPEAINLRLVR